MNEVLIPKLSKAKEMAYSQDIDALLSRLKENIRAIKETNRQIERLRKTNDKSFDRAKRAVEGLRVY
jgi:hypothetical protein